MLRIENKNIKTTKQTISIGKLIKDGINGYNINIQLSFINVDTNEGGYINLDAGFEKEKDIKPFLNREYYGTPFDNDDQFIYFEVFDTEKFLDSDIESKILIQIKDITDHKVQASFVVNDELIKIEYDGYLNLVFGYEKETFLSQ